jgi:hypothetical protein
MHTTKSQSILQCTTCDSRRIEIYDPITDCATVYCAQCGDERMTFRELVSELEARVKAQDRTRWFRHLH